MTDTNRRVLACPMGDNAADAATVGQYLITLLSDLWELGEGFNSKRPFGMSCWDFDIYEALIAADFVEGELDEDGYIKTVDSQAAKELVADAIRSLLPPKDQS
jgi:hypothetical protein